MLRYLVGLFLPVVFLTSAYAQASQDTLMYYIDKYGDVVKTKEQSEYVLFIMPETFIGKKKLYPMLAIYPNGKRKMIASSNLRSSHFNLEGSKMMFFPSGKRSSVANYKNGVLVGEEVLYYPNGMVYARKEHRNNKIMLIEYRDSLGNIHANNGNGRWVDFEDNFTSIKSQGEIQNGLRVGRWENERRNIAVLYKNGLYDEVIVYYPNGKLYTRMLYNRPGVSRIECRDSLGNILTENGNGKWVMFDDLFKNIIGEGEVKKGLPTGSWNMYHANGILDEGDDPSLNSQMVNGFIRVEVQPEYPGGTKAFGKFLELNIRYPSIDKNNNIQGKVFVNFIVEKDGTLSNIAAVNSPSKTLTEEAVRVMRQSPKWTPGSIKGRPIRVQYTVPINFTLGDEQ